MVELTPLILLAFLSAWRVATLLHSRDNLELPDITPTRGELVLVVIPSCADGSTRKSLPTWLRQSYKNYRVIVVEDCGGDYAWMGEADRYRVSLDGETYEVEDRGVVKVVRRSSRRGFKAGALNDAVKLVDAGCIRGLERPKYLLIVDADHSAPDENTVSNYVGAISVQDPKVVIVQGGQVHRFFRGFIDAVLQYSYELSTILGIGRTRLGLFPIFTGSSAIMKYDVVSRLKFNEGTVSEDFDFSVRLLLSGHSIVTTYKLYTIGRPPRNLRYFITQQLRWSSGTTRVFLKYLPKVLRSRIPLPQKVDYVVQGLTFLQSWLILASIGSMYVIITTFPLAVFAAILLYFLLAYTLTILIPVIYGLAKARLQNLVKSVALHPVTLLVHAYGSILGVLGRETYWVVTKKKLVDMHQV